MTSDEWIIDHFDIHAPELGAHLHDTLARARELCPIARSDVYHGGYWVATRYEDVLRIAQDWETWSNQLGISVGPEGQGNDMEGIMIPPVTVDPPLQRTFKRLINRHFTPAAVAPWEDGTRTLVTRLIDGFVERGECDFMEAFARPLPGLAFFDLALHAPSGDLEQVNDWATVASLTARARGARKTDGLKIGNSTMMRFNVGMMLVALLLAGAGAAFGQQPRRALRNPRALEIADTCVARYCPVDGGVGDEPARGSG